MEPSAGNSTSPVTEKAPLLKPRPAPPGDDRAARGYGTNMTTATVHGTKGNCGSVVGLNRSWSRPAVLQEEADTREAAPDAALNLLLNF